MPEQGGISRTWIWPEVPQLYVEVALASRSSSERIAEEARQLRQWIDQLRTYELAQRMALDAAYDQLAKRLNELPEMVSYAFFQDNAAAGQTDVALSNGMSVRGYAAQEEGSIVSIVVKSNAARTAGTLTVEATKNGTKVGLTAVLNGTDTTVGKSLQDQGLDTFTIGDNIGCVITTDGAWSPTTADIDVAVGVVLARGVR